MRQLRFALLVLSPALSLGLSLAGCDCSGNIGNASCTTSADCNPGQTCQDGMCVTRPDGGPGQDSGPFDGGPRRCASNDDCGGGICLEGACCASAANVCGRSCCGDGQTCFASACVVPGRDCRTSEDCDPGQYCEPGLGDPPVTPDAGVPDGGTAPVCIGTAQSGRCVALPPRCEDVAPGTPCIPSDCEYRPPVDRLDAIVQWRWGPTATEFPNQTDVWATPAVGRLTDTNCDGAVDELDPPAIVFVSGNVQNTCCSCDGNTNTCKNGTLRVLDGPTGRELWSLRRPSASSMGFSGLSVALGDVDHDGDIEIATVSGEGFIVLVDHTGTVVATSDMAIPGWLGDATNGWGGGLSLADADHDGEIEIAYGRVVFETDGATITHRWTGAGDWGRAITQAISVWVDLDADAELELLAGRTAYHHDGTILWNRTDLPTGFSAVASFDGDPEPEVALVANARVYLLSGLSGMDELPSIAASGTMPGNGGPPTIADFDGDGQVEIGVAWRQYYEVFDADYAGSALRSLWATPNHDLSSSVTGSTVFDFEGDGAAEVVYNDECFLWVYDGRTGAVRFAGLTTSFTATEASLVADVDADGHAEIVLVSNGADPTRWNCTVAPWTRAATMGEPDYGRPAWVGSNGAQAPYRGVTVFTARDESWVGTRTLWNQHAYSVSNVCGDRGDPCTPPSTYGDIPRNQVANWTVGFLNNFRQNVQGEGIFDAADATVSLDALCQSPIVLRASLRNVGAAILPANVEVGFFQVEAGGTEVELGRMTTTGPLFPGQVEILELTAPAGLDPLTTTFRARILVDPAMPTFRECRDDNNQSADVMPYCIG